MTWFLRWTNANHGQSCATENQWHKIAALMLMKLPGKKASITGGRDARRRDVMELRGSSGRQWADLHGFDHG
ncbi:hypothetical protein [Paraburkholderia sp. JPY419]|uniref:hypothetical protein n=1 Tax=Paraburkholderia sp. JPY419 TaxID=667660 RepID=UPI003D222C96